MGAYLSDNALDIDELLHTLGLYEHRYKLPNQLSGGQQLIDIQCVVRQISAHLDIFLYIQVCNQVVHLKHISQVLSAVLRELFLTHILQLVARRCCEV